MRNSSIHFKIGSLFGIALIALTWLFAACPQASAQGFYKEYNVLFNGLRSPERILLLLGGGYGLPISEPFAPPPVVGVSPIADLRTDDQGNTVFLKQCNAFWSSGRSMVTNDGHYVTVDTSFNPLSPTLHNLKLLWYDLDNALLNTQVYNIDPAMGFTQKAQILSDDAGNIYVVAQFSDDSNDVLYSLKFDANGNLLSQSALTTPQSAAPGLQFLDFVRGDDGALLINFKVPGLTPQVIRQNANGTVDWNISVPVNAPLTGLAGNASGGTLFLETTNNGSASAATQIVYTDQTQNVSWSINANTLIGSFLVSGYFAQPLADGGWVCVVGVAGPNFQQPSVRIFKIDAAGNLVWNKKLPFFGSWLNRCSAGKELVDGSLLFGGNYAENPFLLKIGGDGTIFPHQITGHVVHDLNLDCVVDAGDVPMLNRPIEATRQSDGLIYYGLTDANGNYAIEDVDTGTYVVDLPLVNYQWLLCGGPVTVNFPDPNATATEVVDFQVQSLYNCPFFSVNVGTASMRVCRQSTFNLTYCNYGTVDATDAYVELTLPAEFTIDSASATYTVVAPNIFHFEVGDVAVDMCGSINVYATLDCNTDLVGQTLCAQATAYPDTTCAPAPSATWSGASIKVKGYCDADSVRFDIKNVSVLDMDMPQDFVIVDDHVISLQSSFQLDAGQLKTVSLPKDGSTWRISADQVANNPLGTAPATLAVEGCVTGGAPFTTGMVNLFSNSCGNPLFDTDCHTVLNAYDPNEKLAFPQGVDIEHFIEPNTPIEYQINFQNTGTAAADLVVLRDSLSTSLDPASIRMGASSHPYTWDLSGHGVLSVTFAGINLPDSNSNEAASHGFVQFTIEQQKDNAPGTLIENRAGIYFDFNPVVLTNTVYHTIGHDFLEVVATKNPIGPAVQVTVMPNPLGEEAMLVFKPASADQHLFFLYDAFGKIIRTQEFTGENMLFVRDGLPAGVYFFSVGDRKGMNLAAGKIILR